MGNWALLCSTASLMAVGFPRFKCDALQVPPLGELTREWTCSAFLIMALKTWNGSGIESIHEIIWSYEISFDWWYWSRLSRLSTVTRAWRECQHLQWHDARNCTVAKWRTWSKSWAPKMHCCKILMIVNNGTFWTQQYGWSRKSPWVYGWSMAPKW